MVIKITHPFYGIEINSNGKKYKKIKKQLKEIYEELPATKCLNCPTKCGVEADCCKVFSPPMFLIEFLGAMEIISEKTKEEQDELVIQCFDSYLDPSHKKKCVLLEETFCSIYEKRPFACRMFGLYSDFEYNQRLHKYQKELDIEIDQIPFSKQCRNLEVDSDLNYVPQLKSDSYFRKIHDLDVDLFNNKKEGKYYVYQNNSTYMPFDAHFLCLRIGPDYLDLLTDMKIELRKAKKDYEKDKSNLQNILHLRKKEEEVKDFIENIKKSIKSS